MEYRVVKVEKSGNGRIETNVPFPNKNIQFYLDNPFQDKIEYRVYLGSKRVHPRKPFEEKEKRAVYMHEEEYTRKSEEEALALPPRFCAVCNTLLSGRQVKFCQAHALERQKNASRDSRRRKAHPERTPEDWEKIIKWKQAIKQAPPRTMKYHPFYGDPDRDKKMKDWLRKQRRLAQKKRNHPGMAFCFWCEQAIPSETIIKSKRKKGNPPKCCCREHAIELRKWLGTYKILSMHGNHAQQLYKAEHGEVPGYTQRRAALQRPNRSNNRKKRN